MTAKKRILLLTTGGTIASVRIPKFFRHHFCHQRGCLNRLSRVNKQQSNPPCKNILYLSGHLLPNCPNNFGYGIIIFI